MLDARSDGWQLNQAWAGEITCVRTAECWLYLAVFIDLAKRKMVRWAMSKPMNKELGCDALTMALWQRKPPPGLIMHTDRGSQYASKKYRKLIKDHAMIASMSRKANYFSV